MRRRVSVLIVVGLIGMSGCGSDDDDRRNDAPRNGDQTTDGGGSGDRAGGDREPLSMAMNQLGATSGSADPRLRDSIWGISTTREGVGVGFATDNRYAAIAIRVESEKSIQAMATVGTYSVQDDQISFRRIKTTCPDLVRSSAPTTYKLVDNETLWLTGDSQSVVLKRVPRGNLPALVIKWGCFSQDGYATFSEHPWARLD